MRTLQQQLNLLVIEMNKIILCDANEQKSVSYQYGINNQLNLPVFVKLQSQIYKISQAFLIGSKLIQKKTSYFSQKNNFSFVNYSDHICQLDDLNIKRSDFEKLISYFQGKNIQIEVGLPLVEFGKLCLSLQIQSLIDQIESKLIQNLDDFDFFTVIAISHKINLEKLKIKCIKELHLFKFQQFNFNRYDLLQCQLDIFLYVIDLYNQFRNKHCKKCPNKAVVKQIIQSYCALQSVSLDSDALVGDNLGRICEQVQEEEDEEESSESQQQKKEDEKKYKPYFEKYSVCSTAESKCPVVEQDKQQICPARCQKSERSNSEQGSYSIKRVIVFPGSIVKIIPNRIKIFPKTMQQHVRFCQR